ncbi:MAG: hypothetical protein HRU15_20010, partial [Planctomycetes bacterium]|nr:hypothetical protein [Planctomycetota bacterium]
MENLKLTLMGFLILLVLISLVDQNRRPQQMKEFIDHMEKAQAELAQQQDELRDILDELRKGGISVAQGNNITGHNMANNTTATNKNRDGRVKLDVNFLLPVNESHFRRSQVGGTLKYFNSAPKGFNPITENSATSSDLHGLTNDALCSQHPKHPQLWSESLATSCVISDDYLTYTFKLRDNVYWHIPSIATKAQYAWLNKKVRLTAGDFQAEFETSMNPDVECPQVKAYYEDIEAVVAIDDLTLQIKWKKKVYTSLASSMAMTPLPRHVYYYDADGKAFSSEEYGVVFNK